MKTTKHTLTALALALASSAAWGQAAPTECTNVGGEATPTITIAVASNFYMPGKAVADGFLNTDAGAGKIIRVCHNASGTLVQEINGSTSPYSLFLAADNVWPNAVTVEKGPEFVYAYGIPVLWSIVLGESALLTADGKVNKEYVTSLAIGDPNVAPYGVAAVEILTGMEQWPDTTGWITQYANIALTKDAVEAPPVGEGKIAAFISKAQICNLKLGVYKEFQAYNRVQTGIQLANVDSGSTTADFVAYLQSPDVQAQLVNDYCYSSTPPSSNSAKSARKR